jgi:hypothetical protein
MVKWVIRTGKAVLRRWPRLYQLAGDTCHRGRPVNSIARAVRFNLTKRWWAYAPLLRRLLHRLIEAVMIQSWSSHSPCVGGLARPERGARALASSSYRMKIIYPDFFSEFLQIPPINWGENISFRPLANDAMNFAFEFMWVCCDAILAAACRLRPIGGTSIVPISAGTLGNTDPLVQFVRAHPSALSS